VCLAVSASATEPNPMVSQYSHHFWGMEKGFPIGTVSTIAQTADGYLWIGTDKGLVRFDGLNFRRFEQASDGSLTIGPVRALLADAQGNLWILLQNTKLLRYHDGTFDFIRGEAENGVTAMALGAKGEIVLSSLTMGALAYDGKQFLAALPAPLFTDPASLLQGETPDQRNTRLSWSPGIIPDRLAVPTSAVISIAATTDGKIWLGTQDRGLLCLRGGRIYAATKDLRPMKINCLLPLENSELWVGTTEGLWRWNGTDLTRARVPSSLLHIDVLSMIRDRESNTWVGTNNGLLCFTSSGVSLSAREVPATGGPATALFEDREGNLWVGSPRGIERLRKSAFVTYPVAGVQSERSGPVYVDQEGRTWFAPVAGGLHWLKGEKKRERDKPRVGPGCSLFDRRKQKGTLGRPAAGRTDASPVQRRQHQNSDLHRNRWTCSKQCLFCLSEPRRDGLGRDSQQGSEQIRRPAIHYVHQRKRSCFRQRCFDSGDA